MIDVTSEILASLFKTENLQSLREIVIDRLHFSDSKITQHPLGFFHCRLYLDEATGTQLRLHYWQRDQLGKGSALAPFHDHVWRLSSCVLLGEIRNNLVRIVDDPSGPYSLETVHQEREAGRDSVGTGGPRVSFMVEHTESISEGMFYRIEPRQFHFSDLGNCDVAISVVLSEPGVSGNPRTLMPLGSAPHAPTRETLHQGETIAKQILKLLGECD